MRQHGTTAVALELPAEPRTQYDRSGQRNESADRVDDGRSGKVVETCPQAGKEVALTAHHREEAIRSPRPVAYDWIDETGDGDAVEQIADKTCAANHGARGDGRAGIGERKLE